MMNNKYKYSLNYLQSVTFAARENREGEREREGEQKWWQHFRQMLGLVASMFPWDFHVGDEVVLLAFWTYNESQRYLNFN